MCGRYSITLPPEAIRQIFQTHGELPNWPAWYNAAPTTALPVVRQAKDGGGRELVLMTWGLIPWFSKDGKPSFSTINARAEGLRTAASYKDPFAKGRRCLVPASGYFEWTGPKNDRQPHYFTRADGQPMALAGLWDRWRSADKSETKETFTIVTTEPSKFAAQFHNRMPLVLEPDTWDQWMKGDAEAAAALMKPANENVLVSRPWPQVLSSFLWPPPNTPGGRRSPAQLVPHLGLSTVVAPTDGIVGRLFPEEGDRVQSSDPLIVIDIPRAIASGSDALTVIREGFDECRVSLQQLGKSQIEQIDAQIAGNERQLGAAKKELIQIERELRPDKYRCDSVKTR